MPIGGESIHDTQRWRDDAQGAPWRFQTRHVIVLHDPAAELEWRWGKLEKQVRRRMGEVASVAGQCKTQRAKRCGQYVAALARHKIQILRLVLVVGVDAHRSAA